MSNEIKVWSKEEKTTEVRTDFKLEFNGSMVTGTMVWSDIQGYDFYFIDTTEEFDEWFDEDEDAAGILSAAIEEEDN